MLKKSIAIVLFIVFTFNTATPSQEVKASDTLVHKEYMLHFEESMYKQNGYQN